MPYRRLTLASAGAILLALVLLSLYWLWASEQVSAAIAQWTEEQRARGYDITYRGPEFGGFPIALSVEITEPRVTAPDGWSWSGGTIAGQAAFWRPQTLQFDLPRQQTLSAYWRGHRREVSLQTTTAQGLARLNTSGWLQAATIEMAGLALTDESGARLQADTLRYDLTQRPPTMESETDWTLLVNGETRGIFLPEGAPNPFGTPVERIGFDSAVIGAIPHGDPTQALASWRDNGGLLQVRDLELIWGPLVLRADGTATLDTQFRPQGAFAARVRGLPETIDALITAGMIDPRVAFALKLTVLALPTKPDQYGAAAVELPITLQDGLFYLGPVALFRLSPVL